nr:right-handed parallel beta-helix repeat-containing protein [Streptomyces luteolifulvus]
MGGRSEGQVVQNTTLSDPRGWSALHMTEGGVTNNIPTCQNSKILNNTIGPSGEDNGAWADGISLACGNSEVSGNTVTDATDGGIVIFGAPGSQVRNNTITARTRVLLGGINMVDFKPVNGNYAGTVVSGNTVDAAGSFIKIAMAMGTMPWGCGSSEVNYGATVMDNTLTGAHMGYGFVASGVRDWTVTGNADRSTHVGYPRRQLLGHPGLAAEGLPVGERRREQFAAVRLRPRPAPDEPAQHRREPRDRQPRRQQRHVRHGGERGLRAARRQPDACRELGEVRHHPTERRSGPVACQGEQ